MKWALYNLAFAAVYPFLLPGFLLRMLRRGGYAARFADRFSLYPESVHQKLREWSAAGSAPIWIHAVSVGEVQVAGQLMREWRAAEPGVHFCFSTTSSTGWKTAEKEVTDADLLIYNPLDFPNFVKSAYRLIKPRAVVLTESEIWPNFIRYASRHGIPLYLVNARVSDRSAPRYRAARCIFGELFASFTRIFAQSELDADRIRATMKDGGKNVVVTGSFKFDVAHRNLAKEAELKDWICAGAAELPPILLGGSTWPGEDEFLLDVYAKLVAATPADGRAPVLVLAPRHFEKADAVEENIRRKGFGCIRRSRGGEDAASTNHNVYLADTTGELMGLYGLATAVFVGKSLCAHGSQNMIEPCLCGKPTVVGPFTENFRPVMSDLLSAQAICQATDAESAAKMLIELMSGKGAAELGERARQAVERRRGVVSACVESIRSAR